MRHQNVLELDRTALVVIDMQEAFRSKIADFSETAVRIAVMIQAARILNLPVIVTEQYPRGLGRTAEEIINALPDGFEPIEKTAFSSCGANEFLARLESTNAEYVLICGIEAHICVNQTVHDLLSARYRVHLLADCITSRKKENKELALRKMEKAGALPSSTEMALFELLRDAKHESFKAIQQLIK